VTDPSPALLRECATQLRELARKHRLSAESTATLLDSTTKLCGTDTWSGTYAAQTDADLTQWASGLDTDAAQMRSDAAGWVRAAEEFEEKADAKDKAAAKTGS